MSKFQHKSNCPWYGIDLDNLNNNALDIMQEDWLSLMDETPCFCDTASIVNGALKRMKEKANG